MFVAELCAVEHEPFMRMRPHRLHAVFHGEVAVGSPGTVFGGFLQTVYDFVLYLEREASPGAELRKYSWCRLESATFSDSLQSMPSMSATFPKERFFISDTMESRGTS